MDRSMHHRRKGFVFLLVITMAVCLPALSGAFLKGDIDDDGVIGLPESINALRAVAGMSTTMNITTINVPADVATIQGAVDAAGPGDVISVAAGTYAEHLVITKDNVTIQGAGADTTIVDGGGAGIVISINNARNVLISGLQIINGEYGIMAYYSRISLSANRIEGHSNYGMRVRTNSFLTMAGDQVKNNFYGMRITFNTSASLADVTVSNNSRFGIRADGNCSLDTARCTISGNGRNGLRVERGSHAYFMTNSVAENNGQNGVMVQLSGTATIGDVTISGNGYSGVGIDGGSSVQIWPNGERGSETLITGNGTNGGWGSGIGINGNSYCIVSGGTGGVIISGNQGGGINANLGGSLQLQGGSGVDPVTIAGNSLANNNNGISAFTSSQVRVQGDAVHITGNGGFGIGHDCADSPFYNQATIDFGTDGAEAPGGLNSFGTDNCLP